MITSADSYRGRRVLVIGGLGYIGSNLSAALIEADAVVTIVTPDRGRHRETADQFDARGARIVEADIRRSPAMRATVRGQDVVFNVSGQSGALQSVHDPIADLDVNCTGNLVLLEALRTDNPGAKLVFASSRLVYGAPRSLPVSEHHEGAPLCPHGVHKALVEHYLTVYGHLHGLRSTTLRITNPYGPGQPAERKTYGVVNYLIHRALSGQTLPIFGDGTQVRDYVYIGDVVGALLRAGADAKSDGRTYNVASGAGIAMIDAARLIIETAGAGRIEFQAWPPLVREIDTGDFIADVSRIDRELGWRPSVTFAEGLRRTMMTSTEDVRT
jgi:UDP-glucose 4-epimerase